jgi:tRNA threonylcarbamoyl adenosine modification protein YeaZ
MLTLAMDTSTARVTVAVLSGIDVLADVHAGELVGSQFHGELLAGLVKDVLDSRVPDRIVVGLGPGPYTGLRVGITTAEVLAAAWNIPVVGVPTLAGLASGYRMSGGGECVSVLDVKRKEIAWQHFDAAGSPLSEPSLTSIAALETLPTAPLVGPAFVTQTLVCPEVADASPVSAIALARIADSFASGAHLQPLYLRLPDAADPKKPKSVLNG